MRNNQPKVTIVTVTYNAEQYIESTIKSVIKQDYPNIEHIIIDGASTDATLDIIKRYEKYITIWVSESDMGIYDAMNKGITLATGEWINFMNAGDNFVSSNTISQFIASLKPSTELYCGAIYFEDQETHKCIYKQPYTNEKIWETIAAWHQASFIKTSVMKEFYYSLCYKIASDHEFFVRCYLAEKNFQFTGIPIATMISGGAHQQYSQLAQIESMHILAKYAPQIELVYQSNFCKKFYVGHQISNKDLFTYNLKEMVAKIEQINKLSQKVVLYGYGTIGQTLSKLFKHLVAVIDVNESLKDSIKIPFFTLESFEHTYQYDIIVISVLGHEDLISQKLVEIGVDRKKIYTFDI